MTLPASAAAVACGLICFGVAVPMPAGAQSQVQPIIIRPDSVHQNCQIYLSTTGNPLLFKGKPISASGACPSDYMRGTVTRLGPGTYRLRVSGADCILTAAGLGGCR
jgi:hypothetical protein